MLEAHLKVCWFVGVTSSVLEKQNLLIICIYMVC